MLEHGISQEPDTNSPKASTEQESGQEPPKDAVHETAELQREVFKLATAALVCHQQKKAESDKCGVATTRKNGIGCGTTQQPPGMFIGMPAVEAAIKGNGASIGLDITQLSPLFLYFLAWQRLSQVRATKKSKTTTTTSKKQLDVAPPPNRSTSKCRWRTWNSRRTREQPLQK